jgi:hypothetical protein
MVHHPDTASDNSAVALSIRRTAQLSYFSRRVTYRLATSHDERDAIFKLRYQSYLLTGLISKNSFERYIETADHAANSYLIGLYVGCKLVSSLRLQIGSATTPNFSSLELFPHVLKALLEINRTIVDMGCVAAEGGLSGLYVWLPYLALRPWIMAAEYFHADYMVAATRPEYRPFYQRALGCELHSGLQPAPHHTGRVALVTLDFATSAKRLYESFPFLRSTPAERQRLFEHKQ